MTTPTTVQVRLQIRADTAANWASVNPVLLVNELGLETDTKKFKIGDGTTVWNSLAYFPSIVSGGTVLGNLEIGTTGTLTFEGSTADGFETTLGVVDPTADRTILLPDQSGTVVIGGNASIVDADIAANAEIAVSKLANGTANQVLVTDGTDVSWSDNLTLAGDLTVNGTTTTINTETLTVKDKNIELAVVDTPTDVTADGGGITLKGTTDKTINWIDATDAWTSSERFSVPLGSASAPSLTFTGDENTGIYSPGADQLALSTNGTGRLFVDSAGKVSVGTDTSLGSTFTSIGGIVTAANDATATCEVTRGSTDANPPRIFINKARGTYTSQTLVSSGDGCGEIIFRGHDGTGLRNTAAIVAAVDGTPGSGSMPGRLVLSTTPSGSTGAVERLRITSAGLVGIGTSAPGTTLSVNGGFAVTGGTFPSSGAGLECWYDTTKTIVQSYSRTSSAWLPLEIGASQIALNTSGAERARIDSSGRLLVGTSTSTSQGDAQYARIQIVGNSVGDSAFLTIARNEGAANITSNEGIGQIFFTDNAGNQFASITATADANAGTNDYPGRLVFSTTADGASSPTERMRIGQNGSVILYNTAYLYPNTDSAVTLGGGTNRFTAVYAVTGTIQTSDQRQKTQIVNSALGSDFIKSLRPVSYKWIEGGNRNTTERDEDGNYIYESVPGVRTHWGFIAQEVKQAVDAAGVDFGGWVLTDKDDPDSTQALRYDQFIAPLTKALQEALEKIETLEAKVAALESA